MKMLTNKLNKCTYNTKGLIFYTNKTIVKI